MTKPMEMSAVISPCGLYRYRLSREWEPGTWSLPIIMLNPSTADAHIDDPTIKRCMAFARREGCGGIWVANLFALRATNPEEMKAHAEPVGSEGDEHLLALMQAAAIGSLPIVVAWGTDGDHRGRATQVRQMAKGVGAHLVCLGKTKAGHPRHPLYVRGVQPFEPYGDTDGQRP